MIRIPGGTFRMGSDRHYPEEAPVHSVTVDGFWIDATPVTNAQFRDFVQATGYVTWAEIDPDPKDYPGAKPGMLKAGGLVFTPPNKGRPARLEPVVALHLRRQLAAALRQGQPHRRARRSSRGADRLQGCRGLCQMGGQGTADRGGVGVRRPRRPRRRGVRLGRRVHARRQAHGQHLAGQLPEREPARPTAGRAPRRCAPSPPTATASTT